MQSTQYFLDVGLVPMLRVLQVAFIILKLCGVIQWSWWWVLAPAWISVVLIALLLCVLAALAAWSEA